MSTVAITMLTPVYSDLTYWFPTGATSRFTLQLAKVVESGWAMTFADIADDLEALYYAGKLNYASISLMYDMGSMASLSIVFRYAKCRTTDDEDRRQPV